MPAQPAEKRFVQVHGHRMAYVERGQGAPVVFLHGNPTSSYLWRDVISPVVPIARCIAPDLVGMGDSDKLADSGPHRYRFDEHRRFLDGFLEAVVGDEPVVLVVHDWGSGLGFDWARRHPAQVRGIAYMEAIFPMHWSEWSESGRGLFQALRSEAGEELILERNVFVEQVLPGSILRDLSQEELEEYRRPFADPGEGRRPTLSWPRELPIDGEPAGMWELAQQWTEFLQRSPVPKLFVNADPGAIVVQSRRDLVRGFPNQEEVTVAGRHFVQEDAPDEIGGAIADWLRRRVF